MSVRDDLEKIAGRPVLLDPQNYDFAVACRVDGLDGGARVFATQYRDPNDGYWYELRTSINDYLTQEQIDNLETKHLEVAEAQEALRNFVRKVMGKQH